MIKVRFFSLIPPSMREVVIMTKKILIVDDYKDLREMILNQLESSYDVSCAENGAEALKVLRLKKFDLVVTDFNMPLMDGLELSKKVKEEWPELPLIMMTGRPAEVRLEGTNILRLLVKPFSIESLVREVNKILPSNR